MEKCSQEPWKGSWIRAATQGFRGADPLPAAGPRSPAYVVVILPAALLGERTTTASPANVSWVCGDKRAIACGVPMAAPVPAGGCALPLPGV